MELSQQNQQNLDHAVKRFHPRNQNRARKLILECLESGDNHWHVDPHGKDKVQARYSGQNNVEVLVLPNRSDNFALIHFA